MSLRDEIEQAIADHAAWKTHFRDFVNGRVELDAATAGLPNHCLFGEWLEKEGERMLLPRETHDEIYTLHAEFHRVAAETIKMKHSGDINGAIQAISPNGIFGKASAALVQRMLKLKL